MDFTGSRWITPQGETERGEETELATIVVGEEGQLVGASAGEGLEGLQQFNRPALFGSAADTLFIQMIRFDGVRHCFPCGLELTGTVGKDDYGNVCLISDKYDNWFLNQRVAKVNFANEKLTKEYLFWVFRHPTFKAKLIQQNRGVRQANISNKDILGLEVPVPPLLLQKEFAVRMSEIRAMQAEQAASRRRLEKLFQSMLHRAFNGEL